MQAFLMREARGPAAALASLLLVVLATGCGGRGAGTALDPGNQPPAQLPSRPLVPSDPAENPGLPQVADLLAVKATAGVDDDRFRTGASFVTTLLNASVTATGTRLDFAPQWAGVGRTPQNAGIAVYELQTAALSGAQTLTLHWSDPPKDYANLFVGLSNFATGRWVWMQGLDTALSLPSLEDYRTGDGRTFVAVMLLGAQPAQLDWVRFGANIAPNAVLVSSADTGATPYNLPLDASGSTDPDGSIARYDYDLDNDGVFELQNQAASFSPLVVNPPGTYTATVQVTDAEGATDTASISYTLLPGGGPPLARLRVDYAFADAPFTATFDASASVVPNGGATYEWDFNNDGTYETNTGATPTAQTSIAAGSHTVTMRVTDGEGESDTSSVTCFGSGPGYDEVEDNDDFSTGNIIPALGIRDFTGNLGDTGTNDGDLDDWYRIVISEPMAVQFNMYFLDADADLDMRLFAPDGTAQLASSVSTDDDEQITYTFTQDGTYFLRTYRYGTTSSSADYTLEFLRLIPPAAQLQATPTSGNAPLTVNFTATATDSDGTVDEYAWDFNGDGTFEYSSGATPSASHTYTSGGTFNAAVRAIDNDGAAGIAQVAITSVVNYNEVEPNDTAATGQLLSAPPVVNFTGNIGIGGPVDGDEEDWYRIAAANGDELCVVLSFDDSEADIDLEALAPDGTTVLLSSLGTDNDEYVTFVAAAAGNHHLRVFLKDSATDRGPTDYQLTVFKRTAFNEVEDNDTFGTANALPARPFTSYFGNLGAGGPLDGDESDWYSINLAQPGSVTLRMRFVDASADLDMRLYGTDGTSELAASTGTDNDEQIIYTFANAGTYYLNCFVYVNAADRGPLNYLLQAQ